MAYLYCSNWYFNVMQKQAEAQMAGRRRENLAGNERHFAGSSSRGRRYTDTLAHCHYPALGRVSSLTGTLTKHTLTDPPIFIALIAPHWTDPLTGVFIGREMWTCLVRFIQSVELRQPFKS